MANIVSEAVKAALLRDWKKAILLNKELLKKDPNDIEVMNRLAYAFIENGDLEEAKKYYFKVLKIDKHNPLAEKNLSKIQALSTRKRNPARPSPNGKSSDISSIFLEEPGRTKITKLRNVAEAHILSTFRPADEVTLSIKGRSISVKAISGVYIGALPDDINHRLIPFIKGGNEYKGYIKSVEKNSVSLLIKEVKRSNRFRNTPSFLATNTTYYSFVREETIKEGRRPDVSTYEDLEEESDEKEDSEESE